MKKNILALSLMLCAVLLVIERGIAEDKEGAASKKRGSIFKTTGTPAAALLNINKISAWYESNGEMERNPADGNSGFTYPRGTATAIYASGLVWGARVTDGKTPVIRAGGTDYQRGVQPGAILGTLTGKYEDAKDDNVRLWRIRRDYATADLRQDAAETNTKSLGSVTDGDIDVVRKQYEKDWEKWPAEKGAPFYDRDGDGLYKPKFTGEKINDVKVPDLTGDEPGIADADQVIWFVSHDLAGPSQWSSPQIGLEQQTTIWGYNRSDALGNVVFKKFKLIYKGTATSGPNARIDDMYLCQWSDPDLGDAGDDYAGCDTLFSLGYVYNSKTLDKTYRPYDIAPPASGYDFLQGPLFKGVAGQDRNKNKVDDAVDFGIFDLKKVGPGKINLPMTSFIYFAAGGKYSDPPHNAIGAIQWYQMLRGLPPTPTGPPDPPQEVDPKTGLPTSFWLPGDPVTGKGWIDGLWDTPGDRRIMLTSGPFNMAIGDTQELVSATLAGLGSDRLSSVSVLKFYDKAVQSAYDSLFDLPKPPVAPKFSIVELDNALIVEWEKDSSGVVKTEGSVSKGYKFEGYNVYQLPSAASPLSNAVKIATFDLTSDPAAITEEYVKSGELVKDVVQSGKNTGLSRYMLLKTDAIKNRPFINGQRYYFAITAYNYLGDPLLTTHSFESSPIVQEAIPHPPSPGVVLPYKIQDTLTLPTKNVVGSNDANVAGVIFNPTLQTGGTFDVWYGGAGIDRDWTVVKNLPGTNYAVVTATIDSTLSVANIGGVSRANSNGFGVFTINDAKTQIRYSIKIDNVSSNIDSAYIRLAPTTRTLGIVATGPIVKTLNFGAGATSGVVTGTWTTSDATEKLDSSLVVAFTSGKLYVNIHTAKYPKGEIRGQISDGLFRRANLPVAVTPLPPLTTYTEYRVAREGVSFYGGPAPQGFKAASQSAPTSGNVVNVVNPEGTYKLIGPSAAWGGAKETEATLEIRFQSGDNWAITTAATPAAAYYVKVPFAVYKDTVRVWPVIADTKSDTLWNTTGNAKVNDVPTWDAIAGIVDTTDASGNIIKYYSPSFPQFPPTSALWKGRFVNGVNHIAKNITFTNEKSDGVKPATGTSIKIIPNVSVKPGDIKTFTLNAIQTYNATVAKQDVNSVNVFPNPYYGLNSSETSREVRFVTISHLPQKATVRVFNLAGTLVRTLLKDDGSQFLQWDLLNEQRLPVASGMYLLHIDMGDLGVKVLKCAIIQEQQFLRNY